MADTRKIDFEHRQEVNGLIALDADELEAALYNIVWERDAARSEMTRLRVEIRKAVDVIPGSMGGHVTIGLNILQAAVREVVNG